MNEAALLGGQAIRQIAAELGLRPSKQRGQNFVTDANTVRRIVALSGVGQADIVLEVGPGLGSLTLGLLATGARVVAIEIDSRLANRLPQTIAERMPQALERLSVISADALQVNQLPTMAPTAVVANLPYNVSVPVLIHLMTRFDSWQNGLVLVQKEVADRLSAAPGNKTYGVPSAKVAWFAQATRAGIVPPKVFWPVPNVDSGLVRLIRRPPPKTSASQAEVFQVIDAAFAQRRKMLRTALAGLAGSSATAQAAITAAGVSATVRGEALDIVAFAQITEQLIKAGVKFKK